MQRMLKTAEPTMVPTPTSPFVMKTPAQQIHKHWSAHMTSSLFTLRGQILFDFVFWVMLTWFFGVSGVRLALLMVTNNWVCINNINQLKLIFMIFFYIYVYKGYIMKRLMAFTLSGHSSCYYKKSIMRVDNQIQ